MLKKIPLGIFGKYRVEKPLLKRGNGYFRNKKQGNYCRLIEKELKENTLMKFGSAIHLFPIIDAARRIKLFFL
jgi:hypothetical protein